MKKNKQIPSYKVINWNFNSDNIEYYDVFPYFINCWEELMKGKRRKGFKKPETFEEFKEFIKSNSMYMFWSRCQYEVIVTSWPKQKNEVKIDVHQQIENNLDLITNIFMNYVNETK